MGGYRKVVSIGKQLLCSLIIIIDSILINPALALACSLPHLDELIFPMQLRANLGG